MVEGTSYRRENENLAGRLYSRSGPLTTFRLNCSPKVENILVKFGNLSNPLQFKFQFFSLEKKLVGLNLNGRTSCRVINKVCTQNTLHLLCGCKIHHFLL